MLKSGRKYDSVLLLDKIAAGMGTERPKTELWSVGMDVSGRVLKREFSDAGAHVLLPGRKTRRDLMPSEDGGYRWLVQEYAPLLASFGEWRVFFTGGRLTATVLTTKKGGKGMWTFAHVHVMRSLTELR